MSLRSSLALVSLVAALNHRASCREPPNTEENTASSAGGARDPDLLPDGGRLPARIHARHLLVMYRGSHHAPETITRTREEARTRALEALRRARAGEDFARLVTEFSDEPGASERGGDLDSFGRGQMVGPFEEAAFRLQINELSEVVETTFGFHVIQRLPPR